MFSFILVFWMSQPFNLLWQIGCVGTRRTYTALFFHIPNKGGDRETWRESVSENLMVRHSQREGVPSWMGQDWEKHARQCLMYVFARANLIMGPCIHHGAHVSSALKSRGRGRRWVDAPDRVIHPRAVTATTITRIETQAEPRGGCSATVYFPSVHC